MSSPNTLDSAAFRKWGKDMVNYVADYWDSLPTFARPCHQTHPGYLSKLIPDSAPEEPETYEQIMADVNSKILPGLTHRCHPRFLGELPTANSTPAVLGDMLSTGLACIGFSWISDPAMTEVEMVVTEWLARALNLPEQFYSTHPGPGAGMIQCTATDCMLVALLGARSKTVRERVKEYPISAEVKASILGRLVVYASNEAAASLDKAARVANLTLKRLTADGRCSLRGEALESAIKADIANGLIPHCVIATLGTEANCAFDRLDEIGPICQKYNLWLHVDAAYAGAAAVCPEYSTLFNGLQFADTINVNAHNWLQVNFDCAVMWFKDTDEVETAFMVNPLYLKHDAQGIVPDYRHWQVPLGRRFRSLKLWFVLRAFGLNGLREHVQKQIKLATEFNDLVNSDSRFEVLTGVQLGLVTFRLKKSDQANQQLANAIKTDGRIDLGTVKAGNKECLRFVIGSPLTTLADVKFAWSLIQECTQHL